MFGFTGVCVLVDKLDETSETDNSVEATARLIHPLLANIQLLEVDGFSWMFFVWGNVEDHFNNKLKIRLIKLLTQKLSGQRSSFNRCWIGELSFTLMV